MTSRRGLWAALLLTGVSARAQFELRVAPVVSAPAGLASAAAAPALSVAAPSGMALALPAVSAALAAPVAFAAPAAEPIPSAAAAASVAASEAAPGPAARAEAIRGAVADFAHLDLRTIDAGTAREAGEDLMTRALGGAAAQTAGLVPGTPSVSGPRLAPPGRRLYLLSKPLRETVSLGPVAMVAHVGCAVAWELFKAWLGWHATGHIMGAVAVMAVELPFSPAMVTGRSLLDLGVRYWRRKLAVMRQLARAPGVERVRVLTAGHVEFTGPLARRKENLGLIFIDASAPPPPGRFGAAIPIADARRQQVRLTLEGADFTAAAAWTPTLADLLERRPLPPEIAAAWRGAFKAATRSLAPAQKLLRTAQGGALRVAATLVGGPSGERGLGAIVEGPAVKTFIGLGHLDRARALLGRVLKPRAIPLSDTTVVRAGERLEPGLFAFLSRVWGRLTGGLIVAPRA